VAIADFGLSKVVADGQTSGTFVGTPEYIAPEIVFGNPHNKQVDWWSFGILIYEMIVGVPPFRHKNQHALYQMILSREVYFPDPVKDKIIVSVNAKDLIIKLTQKDPEKRLGAKNDADEILNHPFFKGIDKAKLLNKQIPAEYKPEPNENPAGTKEEQKEEQKGSENSSEGEPKSESKKLAMDEIFNNV